MALARQFATVQGHDTCKLLAIEKRFEAESADQSGSAKDTRHSRHQIRLADLRILAHDMRALLLQSYRSALLRVRSSGRKLLQVPLFTLGNSARAIERLAKINPSMTHLRHLNGARDGVRDVARVIARFGLQN